MIPESMSLLASCRRPLLLQGPMGPFFSRLAEYLARHGAIVRKVHFNGGDEYFYRGRDALRYTGALGAWADWLRELIDHAQVDAIVLFGQSRPVHRIAIDVARECGLQVFVFEEGYIRPHYVTLEIGGVNGHSSLPRHADFYRDTPYPRLMRPQDTGQRFARMAWCAMQYATASLLGKLRYRHEVYHRELNPVVEMARWLRGGMRKLWFAVRERHMLPWLTGPAMSGRWFLLPLQVHNDAQITEHSEFEDMPHVICSVMASFAAHSGAQDSLVIKHHPMDRPYRDYQRQIDALAGRFGLRGRVHYVHDLHLPTLLKHARGVVTVNSTTGLQAMYHGTPVCVLGECLYALPGLVHTSGLDSFWHAPEPTEWTLYRRFRAHVIRRTQLNASFYGRAPALRSQPELEPVAAPAATASPAAPARVGRRGLFPAMHGAGFEHHLPAVGERSAHHRPVVLARTATRADKRAVARLVRRTVRPFEGE